MSLPDAPQTPLWLQKIQIILAPVETWSEWKRLYGDNFRIGKEPPTICFSSPKAIETILTAPSDVISSRQTSEPIKNLVGGNSILYLEGDRHRRERKLLMPMFHKDSIRRYNEIICSTTEQAINRLGSGKAFKVRSLTNEITLSVLLKAIFGLESGQRYTQLKNILSQISSLFSNPLFSVVSLFPTLQQPWGIWQDFLKLQNQLEKILLAEISDRRQLQNLQGRDIFSLLILARDEFNVPLSESEIRDELMTFVFAGYETTAAAISWSLYWTHYLPNVFDKLMEEVTSNSTIEPEAIAKLPYLNAVCSETLRLYPIAMNAFGRQVVKPITIDGFDLQPGTNINISIFLAHRRESTFPNADKFIPQRFLEQQCLGERSLASYAERRGCAIVMRKHDFASFGGCGSHRYSPYEYLPFGGGDRRCLGASLALQEMKLVLFTILSKVKLEIVNPHLLRPIRYGVAMIPPDYFSMQCR